VPQIIEGEGLKRTHVESRLMRESLMDKKLLASTKPVEEVALLPEAHVVGIGGRSIMDRGRRGILPLCEQIVLAKDQHKLIVGVSGGTRMRHVFSIGLDLGLPTGGLAQIAGAVEEQNAALLQAILSPNGGVAMCREHFPEMPKYLGMGIIPIIICMPPYHFWEEPPEEGRLPMNGPDLGLFITAEVLGARRMVFVKDQKGLYTANPETDPAAEFIPEATAQEVLDANYPELIIERQVFESLRFARHVREIQIIDGLVPENLPRALAGEHVGTLIRSC